MLTKNQLSTLQKRLKATFAAHHFLFKSENIEDIAELLNLSVTQVESIINSPYFEQALYVWGKPFEIGDLKIAKLLWETLIENDEHVFSVEYPEEPFVFDEEQEPRRPILPNTFVATRLSDDQIRERLAEYQEFEGEIVRYDDFEIRGYHFWVYANFSDSIFSSVYAKMNVTTHLVVDVDDDVYLVAITDGKLTLTQDATNDDIILATDERLRVCL